MPLTILSLYMWKVKNDAQSGFQGKGSNMINDTFDVIYMNMLYMFSWAAHHKIITNALFLSYLQCVGADIVYDQLGVDVDSPLESDYIDKLSSIIVYYMLTGESTCPLCLLS